MGKGAEKAIEWSDEQPVIIHDELAEVEADDPTFAGMRAGARLEEAYPRVIAALREQHRDRFRHQPPADPLDLFEELAGEVLLPGEEALRTLLVRTKEKGGFSPEEEERIMAAVERLDSGGSELRFSE